ncbi:MAG: DUF1475 family protein [Candidatus Omnitrophica bacterium]|nr:DUF1475 family protein [Candidatus Omnitrophota bacterium]
MNQRRITASVLWVLRGLFGGLSLAMACLAVWTSMRQNMFQVSLQQPWFATTLVDYYFNVTILLSWVYLKESRVAARVLWSVSFITLGSIASCFYVFWQLGKLRPGDTWGRLLLNPEDTG